MFLTTAIVKRTVQTYLTFLKKCGVITGQTQNNYPTHIPAPLVHNRAPVTCIKSGLTQCTVILIA